MTTQTITTTVTGLMDNPVFGYIVSIFVLAMLGILTIAGLHYSLCKYQSGRC